jgi:hypothetical protein
MQRRYVRVMTRTLFLFTMAGGSAACAGSTIGSGVGDTFLKEPPYYSGRGLTGDTAGIAYLPIAYQRGGFNSPLDFEGGAGSAVAALLSEMNSYLASIAGATRIELTTDLRGTPPDVMFDCSMDGSSDCVNDSDKPRMRLAIGRPSNEWIAAANAALDGASASRVLLLTLEGGNYWVRQTNWRGSKAVELGSGYNVSLPWLTSLDDPVSVLQITGALIDRDGRAIRIGAEGLLARRNNLLISAIGAQTLITDEDVEKLRTARREDLPGQPLVWQVALRHLVAQLTGRPELVYR